MKGDIIEKFDALYQHVLHSKNSDFYRKLYKDSGVQRITSMVDWESLPILTRDAIVETPLRERLYIPYEEVAFCRASSGTSGNKILVSPRSNILGGGRINSFSCVLQFSMPPTGRRHSLDTDTTINVIDGDLSDIEGSIWLAKKAGVDYIAGLLFAIEACIPLLQEHGLTEQIREIMIAGEAPSQHQLTTLRKTFPNARIILMFAASELGGSIGVIEVIDTHGMQAYKPSKSPHWEAHWEIISDAGEICKEDGAEGEAVITQLGYEGNPFPVVRYRTGDRFKIIKNDTDIRYQSLGRTNLDIIRIPGGVLQATEISRVLADLHSALTDDFELHYYAPIDENATYKIVLHIRTHDTASPTKAFVDDIAKEIERSIRIAPRFTLADGVAKKIFEPLEVKLVREFKQTGNKRARFFKH